MSEIWRIISSGPHGQSLFEAASTLHAVARSRESNMRTRTDALAQFVTAALAERHARDAELREIEAHIRTISVLCKEIGNCSPHRVDPSTGGGA